MLHIADRPSNCKFSLIDLGGGYEYYFSDEFATLVKNGAIPYLPQGQENDTVNLMVGQARCLFNCQVAGSG